MAPTPMTDPHDDPGGRSLSQLLAGFPSKGPLWEQELALRLHGELRDLAAGHLRRLPPGTTLQPTDLVHEAWMRFAGSEDLTFRDRAGFFAFAGSVMRAILVDRARAAGTLRRGGGAARVSLALQEAEAGPAEIDLLALDEALSLLHVEDAETARLVVLRFFGGLTQKEVAELTGTSLRQVERRWRFAKAWLRQQLEE